MFSPKLIVGLGLICLLTACPGGGSVSRIADSTTSASMIGDGPVKVWLGSDLHNHITISEATTTNKGIVQIGTGLDVNSGVASVHYGTDSSSAAVGNDARFGNALKIQGNPINAPSPQVGQVLSFDGTSWVNTSGGAGTGTMASQNANAVSISGGNISNVNLDLNNVKTGFSLPHGTTSERPATPNGNISRFNDTTRQVEFYDGSAWQTLRSTSNVAPTISSINGQSGSTQTLSVNSSGTTPSFSSSSNAHVLNIPMASATGVVAGLVSKNDYDTFSSKQSALGFAPVNKAGDSMSGNLDMINNQILNIADPTTPQGVSSKKYADTNLAGISVDVSSLTNGQSLRYDAGTSKWVTFTPSSGSSVSSVGVTAPLTSSGGSSPVLGISTGNGLTTVAGSLILNAGNGINFNSGAAQVKAGVGIKVDTTGVSANIGSGSGQVMGADAVPSCLAGEILKMSLGPVYAWSCAALPTPATNGTVTQVNAGTGLLGGPITNAGTLSVNVGTGANQIVQLDATGKLPIIDGSKLTNVSATNIAGIVPITNLPVGTTSSTVAAGDDLRFTNSRAPSGAASGDLSGIYPNPLVSKIQGFDVSATAPSNGQVLSWNSVTSKWEATSISSGTVSSVSASSPLTVSSGSTTPVVSLQAGTVSGQSLRWTGTVWGVAKSKYTDLENTLSLSPWPTTSCTSGQGIVWSSISDSFICQTLSIATSQLTGSLLSAQLPAFTGDVTSSSGSSTLSLSASGVASGTYTQVTVDTKGRVTAGSNLNSLSGYGITDAIKNAGGATSLQTGLDAAKPSAGIAGRVYIATDSKKIYEDDGSSWIVVGSSSNGTLTSITAGAGLSGGTITSTGTIALSSIGTAGTFPKVTTDAYGRVVSGSALVDTDIPSLDASKITSGIFGAAQIPTLNAATKLSGTIAAAQMPAHTGDVTSSAGATILTLSSVGTAGTYTKVTTDSKGRVISGSNLVASDIPGLDAAWITAGVFNVARIPSLDSSIITSGTFSAAQINAPTCTAGQALTKMAGAFSCITPVATTSGSAGGDLSGTYPNPTVAKIQGVSVTTTTPLTNQALIYNGTSWTPGNIPQFSTYTTLNSGTNVTTTNSTFYTVTAGSFTINLSCAPTGNHVVGIRHSSSAAGATITIVPCASEHFEFNGNLVLNSPGQTAIIGHTNDASINWVVQSSSNLGVTECPTGMYLINSAGTKQAFCIDSSAQTADDWFNSSEMCESRGAELCSSRKWINACNKGGTLQASMLASNGEWTSEQTSATNASKSGDTTTCTKKKESSFNTAIAYRCCINK